MKVVLVKFKDNQRRDFPLTQDKTTIGRGTDCGLRIPARDVSRRHCEIAATAPRPTVNDLGSSNGTFLNGKRITEAALSPGDRLTVGPVTFLVQIDGKPASIKPEDVAPPRAKAAPADVGDDLLDLDDVDFDLDDAALGTDFGDDEPAKGKPAPRPAAGPAPAKPAAAAKPAPPAKPGKKP